MLSHVTVHDILFRITLYYSLRPVSVLTNQAVLFTCMVFFDILAL